MRKTSKSFKLYSLEQMIDASTACSMNHESTSSKSTEKICACDRAN
jgi:hypothetical protein